MAGHEVQNITNILDSTPIPRIIIIRGNRVRAAIGRIRSTTGITMRSTVLNCEIIIATKNPNMEARANPIMILTIEA